MVKTIYWHEHRGKTKAKKDFKKDFLKLMNNAVFDKTMGNVRKHIDIKLVITERTKNYLVFEQNCHTTTKISGNLLATEMKKTQILLNKTVYLLL